MKVHTRWIVTPPPDEALVRRVAACAGVSPLTARLLVARGYTDPEEVRAFLSADERGLHDPRLLPDMEAAAERVAAAVRRGEAVAVYGDYDVDGQTGTALLVRGLSALGLRPVWYIPERVAEGYGLNARAIDELAAAGTRLLISVDCGIRGHAEVARARAAGMDVVITDHHEPGEDLPPALAVVNPKRADSAYPFRELAGVGVAYKLLQAVWAKFGAGPLPGWALQLVALGTVADVCPLVGENRIFVRLGLERINSRPLPGLEALIQAARLQPGNITAGDVAYILGPRLNAAGRVSHAATGVRLLLSDDVAAALPLAEELERENEERRRVEAGILEEALRRVEEEDMLSDWVLVVDGERWHPGVIGIVASRLVERFARPAIVIGLDGEKGKGSGRSIRPFDLVYHLSRCADLLEQFGGHAMAAGLTVARANVPALRRRLNELAAAVLGPADLVPETRIDLEVRLGDVNEQLVLELERLAPFGAGNPTPLLAAPRALILGARTVGRDGEHLKLTLRCPETEAVYEAIGFGAGALLESAVPGTEVQVAFVPRLSEWQGRRRVEVELKALQSPLAAAEMRLALERRPHAVPAVLPGRRPAAVPVVDRRDDAPEHPLARVAYMATLAAGGARLVAALGAGEPAGALVQAASMSLHGSGTELESLPERLEQRWIVLSGDSEPGAPLHVPPAPREPWPGRGHLIVFGLPAAEDLFWSALLQAAASPGWVIHLAYGQAAVEAARQRLERRYPGLEALRWVYRALRARAGAGGILPPAEPLVRSIAAEWPGLVDPEGVAFALDVFEELRLVERDEAGRLRMGAFRQVDVGRSVRYNDGVKVKQLFGAFSRIALEAHPARLIAMAAERSSLDGFAGAHSGSAGLS
ncbi:MAG: single-stranded-DNA-specific exonuclease RecJ [Limnochordales bacterium]|nr:single-stranded-DNA-specific exonuclease RecJ [Bacillota bacterium]